MVRAILKYRRNAHDWVGGPWLASMIVAVLLASILSAAPSDQSPKTRIVASVGGKQITYEQFTDRYEDYLIFTGVQDNVQARFAVLNDMINEILLRDYDDNSKIYENPEYKKEIASARTRTVLAFLEDREVYAKITVTDAELREAYKRSKIRLAVRHLYAPTEKEADNLYHLAKMGISFHQLAKQVFSDTTLRNNGGYLGYITWGETDPDFEKVAYSLKIGEVSRPVKTAEGYSIIRVDNRIEDPFTTEYEFLNEKRKLKRALKIDKKKPYEEAYLKKVFDRRKVRFNEKALQAVVEDLKEVNPDEIESAPHPDRVFDFCAEYKGRKYGLREIEGKILGTPAYDRKLLRDVKTVKEAVLGLLMQDVLLKIAREKGYDSTSYVKETFAQLADNIYLNYKRNEVLQTVPVTDSEVVQYYARHISSYTSERQMNVQEIIVGTDSTAIMIRHTIDRGSDFGTLARQFSLRTWSAKNGGVMGLAPYSRFGELKDTLWNLPLGKVIGPVKFDKYYGIFRVLAKEDGRPIPLSLVRDQIINAVRNEKGFPCMKERLAALAQKTTIKVDDNAVRDFTMKPGEK